MRRIGEHPLWIGTARDARDIKQVRDAGIEAVVDLAMLCEPLTRNRPRHLDKCCTPGPVVTKSISWGVGE